MSAARVAVVIPAAGVGRRMGGVRKQYLELAGEPLLLHTMRPFLAHAAVRWIVVALPEHDAADPPAWLRDLDPRVSFVPGGVERTDSVRRALDRVPEEADVVLVHDGARPLVTTRLIDRTLAAVTERQGAVAAVRIADTVKEVTPDGVVVATADRDRLWRAQTPQAFPRRLLIEAYQAWAAAEQAGRAPGSGATDDAAMVEASGGRVVVVEGDPENLKLTEAADVIIATALLAHRESAR